MAYTRLPTPDRDRELRDAFESDEEEEAQVITVAPPTPTSTIGHKQRHSSAIGTPGAPRTYNFERDYDYPPPGSPPGPLAVQNTWGNSNGILPNAPSRPANINSTWFRRILGPILPTSYQRLPTAEGTGRVIGGGMENGGVFSNLAAKPARPRTTVDANGEVHVMPEETQREAPPTYADAEADAAPSYWGTTIHAPLGLDGLNAMIIDDLPAGPVLSFIANLIVSYFFQFVGFLLTYLLHTNHAAKFGSRAGFGLTLITWGYNARTAIETETDAAQPAPIDVPGLGSMYIPANSSSTLESVSAAASQNQGKLSTRVWVSFLLMTVGWFLLLSSFASFYRVKMWEKHILSAQSASSSGTTTDGGQSAIRRQIQHVFGRGSSGTEGTVSEIEIEILPRRRGAEPVPRTRQERLDAQLARDLRDAGFI